VKLRALLSVALIAAFGAPAVFAGDAQPGWYTMAQHHAALQQKLNEARELWKAGKHEEALARYRALAAARKTSPNSPVMAELRKDAQAINHRAMTELNGAVAAANNGRLDEAAKETERIVAAYEGFAAAQQAKQLLAQIQAAQKQRVIALPGPNIQPPAAPKQPQNPAAPPAAKPPATPATRIPRIKGWYEMNEKAQALEAARIFGRPIALAWHLEGRSKGNLRKWKTSSLAKYCVGLTVASKLNKNTYGLDDELLRRVFTASGLDLQATRPPCVFVCTTGGQFLAIVRADTDKDGIAAVLREVAKKYGRIPTVRQAVGAWKKLDAARKHWSAGKYAAALDYYREVAALEKLNPAMPIIGELHKDMGAIALRGARELEAAKELLTTGKLKEAEARVRQIHRTYKGFDTAKEAKALFAQVRVAQNERAIAAKETGEADLDEPTEGAAKEDDDKADPGKNEDDKDETVDEDDGLEDDF
jgi:hypothetical protein